MRKQRGQLMVAQQPSAKTANKALTKRTQNSMNRFDNNSSSLLVATTGYDSTSSSDSEQGSRKKDARATRWIQQPAQSVLMDLINTSPQKPRIRPKRRSPMLARTRVLQNRNQRAVVRPKQKRDDMHVMHSLNMNSLSLTCRHSPPQTEHTLPPTIVPVQAQQQKQVGLSSLFQEADDSSTDRESVPVRALAFAYRAAGKKAPVRRKPTARAKVVSSSALLAYLTSDEGSCSDSDSSIAKDTRRQTMKPKERMALKRAVLMDTVVGRRRNVVEPQASLISCSTGNTQVLMEKRKQVDHDKRTKIETESSRRGGGLLAMFDSSSPEAMRECPKSSLSRDISMQECPIESACRTEICNGPPAYSVKALAKKLRRCSIDKDELAHLADERRSMKRPELSSPTLKAGPKRVDNKQTPAKSIVSTKKKGAFSSFTIQIEDDVSSLEGDASPLTHHKPCRRKDQSFREKSRSAKTNKFLHLTSSSQQAIDTTELNNDISLAQTGCDTSPKLNNERLGGKTASCSVCPATRYEAVRGDLTKSVKHFSECIAANRNILTRPKEAVPAMLTTDITPDCEQKLCFDGNETQREPVVERRSRRQRKKTERLPIAAHSELRSSHRRESCREQRTLPKENQLVVAQDGANCVLKVVSEAIAVRSLVHGDTASSGGSVSDSKSVELAVNKKRNSRRGFQKKKTSDMDATNDLRRSSRERKRTDLYSPMQSESTQLSIDGSSLKRASSSLTEHAHLPSSMEDNDCTLRRSSRERKQTDFLSAQHLRDDESSDDDEEVDNDITALNLPSAVLDSEYTSAQDTTNCNPVSTDATNVDFRRVRVLKRFAPPMPKRNFDSKIAEEEGWEPNQLDQLRSAHQRVDPTSVSFWFDVAALVDSKTSAECRKQWFSLAKTPMPKVSKSAKQKVTMVGSSRANDDDEDDDIFNSTPLRSFSLPQSNTFDRNLLPWLRKIPKQNHPNGPVVQQPNDSAFLRPKFGHKKFLNEIKRDVARAQKGRKGAKKVTVVKPKHHSEAVHDHDFDVNVRLTPGGTLKVHSQMDEEDDFWNDEYDAEDEENMI